jgi:hypothetical protein
MSIKEYECRHCQGKARITVLEEGAKGTEPLIEFCPFCGMSNLYSQESEEKTLARDKVTRIQHLGELSLSGSTKDTPKFEVIACIGGRGFGVRREDMKKMILSTRGKVFTVKTLNQLIEHTRLKEFMTK